MHIWGEFIVSLWNTGVIDSVVDILMEIWGVLQVLWPVLWVMFSPIIYEVHYYFNLRIISIYNSLMLDLP